MPVEIACPVCGSEDILGGKAVTGRLPLTCKACGHHWERTPPPICQRCGSKDVEETAVQGADGYEANGRLGMREQRGGPGGHLGRVRLPRQGDVSVTEVPTHVAARLRHQPPARTRHGLGEFVDDDPAYLRWLLDHYRGYVLNCERTPSPGYLVVHRAECHTISSTPARGVVWTSAHRNVCAMSKSDLLTWAHEQVGAMQRPAQSAPPDGLAPTR